MKPDTSTQEGSTHRDMIMITICISEAELPNMLLVIKKVCLCIDTSVCMGFGVCEGFTIAVVLVLCTDVCHFLCQSVYKQRQSSGVISSLESVSTQ